MLKKSEVARRMTDSENDQERIDVTPRWVKTLKAAIEAEIKKQESEGLTQ